MIELWIAVVAQCGTIAAAAIPIMLSQRKMKEQLTNKHTTNLRDDITGLGRQLNEILSRQADSDARMARVEERLGRLEERK